MTKTEMQKFIKKIKAYYPIFTLDKDSMDIWYERLKDYDLSDVEEKFERHLNGEYALEPPKLHFLIKYLKTKEEKEKTSHDYLVRCNLCGDEMYLSELDSKHYRKCLLVSSLVKILKKEGKDVTYEELNEYDYETLDKIYEKYVPLKKNLKEILKNVKK